MSGQLKTNVVAEPLPEYARKAPLVFVTRWHIPKQNHDKMVELVTRSIGYWGMDTQRMHPDKGGLLQDPPLVSGRAMTGRPKSGGLWMSTTAPRHSTRCKRWLRPGLLAPTPKRRQGHKQLLDLMVPGTTLEPFSFRAAALARAALTCREGALTLHQSPGAWFAVRSA